MGRFCTLNAVFFLVLLNVLLKATPAHAFIADCYRILGLSVQGTPEVSSKQKEMLRKVDIRLHSSSSDNNSILSMECFLSLANMIPKENHDILLPYWQNAFVKAGDDFLLNYDHLDDTVEFKRYRYYEHSQALYSVIASRIFKHFLPASPKAYLVYEENSNGKQVLGVATESVPFGFLMDHYSDIYNRRIAGDNSRDRDCFSFKNVEEWTALMTYLRFPMSNMGPIGIKNETQEIITVDYSGAFLDRLGSTEPICITSDSLFVLSCNCNETRMEKMRKRISREQANIEKIVHDVFESFKVLSGDSSSHKRFVYGILSGPSDNV